MNSAYDSQETRRWSDTEIPVLYTPINSIEALRQRRLTVQVLIYERDKKRTLNLGYINVKLTNIVPIMGSSMSQDASSGNPAWDFELQVHGLNVIAHNRQIGTFSAGLRFRVIGAPLHHIERNRMCEAMLYNQA